MPELEIELVDGCKLNQPFLKFNVKKKIEAESYSWFDFKCWMLDTCSLSSKFIAIIMATSQYYSWARRINNFLKKCKVHSIRHTSLTFTWVKLFKRPETSTWNSWIIKPVVWPASVTTKALPSQEVLDFLGTSLHSIY